MLATAALIAAAWAGSNALNGVSVAPVAIATHAARTTAAAAIAYPPAVDDYRFATPVPGVYYSNHREQRALGAHCYVNGREWVSASGSSCHASGAGAYGVHEDDDTRILVRVGNVQVGISPWKRIDAFGLRHLEDARNRWLHAHGFTGGVRTFRNDAYAPAHEHAFDDADLRLLPPADERTEVRALPHREIIQPRATITIPVETPRFRQRMRVDRGVECDAPVVVVRRRASFANQAGGCAWRGNSGVLTVRGEPTASSSVIRVLPRETATSAPATRLAQAH
jgi:hypothetical protein